MLRVAVLDDEPAFVELMLRMYGDVKRTLNIPRVKTRCLQETFRRLLNNGVVFVALEGEQLVGTLGLDCFPCWFSGTPMLADVFFYVLPEYRTATHGSDLLKAARDYAIISQTPLQMSIFSGEEIDRKAKLYKRKGLRHVGYVFEVGM